MKGFLSPAPLLAVIVMAVNDFVLKRHYPGLVSGKLSDLAIAFFLPLYVAALLAVAVPRASDRARVLAGCATTLALFLALKLSPGACRLWCDALAALAPGRHFAATPDPTDLVCLPLIALAYFHVTKEPKNEPGPQVAR